QLFWIFYVLPQLGFKLAPLFAATVAFGLNFGAYGAEVVRGALVAVPKAQWEATVALSMSPFQRMRRVLLPQAIPEMIPPFGNLLVQVLKSSSLLYFLAITEFTFEIQELRYQLTSRIAPYLLALVAYFVVAQLLLYVMRRWERRAARKVGRGPMRVEPTTAAQPAPAAEAAA
ncbi:MAG: amino acid ABC transporter permease, partial [Nocardioidaceae bacterium]